MEQRLLGDHGLMLSSLGLGTRTWGLDTDQHEAREILSLYADVGGTTVEVVDDPLFREPLGATGTLLTEFPSQHWKVLLRSGTASRSEGLPPQLPSRDVLLDSLDSSLQELRRDHVDLWLVHGPRAGVPLTEMLSAAETAWRSGKARYIGIGGLNWWDAGSAVTHASANGWTVSAWAQPLSILEPALLDAQAAPLRQSGLGIVAGMPLAGGMLTGKYRHSTPPDARATSPRFKEELSRYAEAGPRSIVEATCRAAEGLDRSAAQVALAWARDETAVTTAVVGPRNARQAEHLFEVDGWRLPRALRDVLAEVAGRGRL